MTNDAVSYAYVTTWGNHLPLASTTLEEAIEEVRSHYYSRTYATAIIAETRRIAVTFDGREL